MAKRKAPREMTEREGEIIAEGWQKLGGILSDFSIDRKVEELRAVIKTLEGRIEELLAQKKHNSPLDWVTDDTRP